MATPSSVSSRLFSTRTRVTDGQLPGAGNSPPCLYPVPARRKPAPGPTRACPCSPPILEGRIADHRVADAVPFVERVGPPSCSASRESPHYEFHHHAGLDDHRATTWRQARPAPPDAGRTHGRLWNCRRFQFPPLGAHLRGQCDGGCPLRRLRVGRGPRILGPRGLGHAGGVLPWRIPGWSPLRISRRTPRSPAHSGLPEIG